MIRVQSNAKGHSCVVEGYLSARINCTPRKARCHICRQCMQQVTADIQVLVRRACLRSLNYKATRLVHAASMERGSLTNWGMSKGCDLAASTGAARVTCERARVRPAPQHRIISAQAGIVSHQLMSCEMHP